MVCAFHSNAEFTLQNPEPKVNSHFDGKQAAIQRDFSMKLNPTPTMESNPITGLAIDVLAPDFSKSYWPFSSQLKIWQYWFRDC
jgi:hypothetical protein